MSAPRAPEGRLRATAPNDAREAQLVIDLPADVVELIAHRAAELVAAQRPAPASAWLSAAQAADYIAAPVSRIHDLVQLRKLEPRRDGRRLVFRRGDLDAYLEAST